MDHKRFHRILTATTHNRINPRAMTALQSEIRSHETQRSV